MPEHVHLLVKPRNEIYKIERFLSDVKRSVSWKAKSCLIEIQNTKWLNALTVKEGAQTIFRFWSPGGGYDQNIVHEKSLWPIVQYIHANPIRRNLVAYPTDWIWSSARFWEDAGGVPLDMDSVST